MHLRNLAFVLFVFVRPGEIVHKVRKEEFILGMAIANRFTGCSFGTMVTGYKITVRCKNIFKKIQTQFLYNFDFVMIGLLILYLIKSEDHRE